MNRNQVGGKIDVLKGRVKKAAGELTNNGQLKSEGTVDKLVGNARKIVGNVEQKIDQATTPHTTVTVARKP
jgi:uncharacterized protein YjbJ (UPF0337 family)